MSVNLKSHFTKKIGNTLVGKFLNRTFFTSKYIREVIEYPNVCKRILMCISGSK